VPPLAVTVAATAGVLSKKPRLRGTVGSETSERLPVWVSDRNGNHHGPHPRACRRPKRRHLPHRRARCVFQEATHRRLGHWLAQDSRPSAAAPSLQLRHRDAASSLWRRKRIGSRGRRERSWAHGVCAAEVSALRLPPHRARGGARRHKKPCWRRLQAQSPSWLRPHTRALVVRRQRRSGAPTAIATTKSSHAHVDSECQERVRPVGAHD
jgi:hypothetical protein